MSTQRQTDDPDSLSQRIAPEWLQPDLCVRSDLNEEPAWLEFFDSNERSAASVWAYDDEDEITIQTKRAVDEELEQMTEDIVYGSSEVTLQPGRILDDSHVLPREAPFETVSVDEQIEQATAERRDEEELRVEEWSLIDAPHRTPLLDESQVLSSEASFATVMSDKSRDSYSPLSEFLVKTNLNSTQLLLVSLLLVSAIAVGAVFSLVIFGEESVFNSPPTENKAAQTPLVEAKPVSSEKKAFTSPDSAKSVAVANSLGQPTAVADPTPKEKTKSTALSETAPRTFPQNSSSDGKQLTSKQKESKLSVKSSRENAKSSASRAATANDNHGPRANTPKRPRAGVKETLMVKRSASSNRTNEKRSSSETAVVKRELATPRVSAVTESPKNESKVPPTTGGAQRPRKVTP